MELPFGPPLTADEIEHEQSQLETIVALEAECDRWRASAQRRGRLLAEIEAALGLDSGRGEASEAKIGARVRELVSLVEQHRREIADSQARDRRGSAPLFPWPERREGGV